MGHVLFRVRQLGAAAIFGILLSFAVFAGAAWATTTTSNSGSTLCATSPGSCAFSGNGSAAFNGQFVTPATVSDPIVCPPQAIDGGDTVCGHFGMDFSNETAKVSVTINFDGNSADFDLCVGSGAAPGAAVVGCSTGTGSTETLTFTVGCADTHFEALILPVMYFDLFPTLPFPYTGSVTASNVATCIGGQGNPPPGSQSATGHNFSLNVIETTGGFKGKVQCSDGTNVFRGTEIDAVAWTDMAKDAKIFGKGTFKSDPNTLVPFQAEAQDNGQGSSTSPPGDIFTIDKCNGGGVVVSGNVTYHTP